MMPAFRVQIPAVVVAELDPESLPVPLAVRSWFADPEPDDMVVVPRDNGSLGWVRFRAHPTADAWIIEGDAYLELMQVFLSMAHRDYGGRA